MKKIIISLLLFLFAFSVDTIAQSITKSDYQKKVSKNFRKKKGRNVRFKNQGYLYDPTVKKGIRRRLISNHNQIIKTRDD